MANGLRLALFGAGVVCLAACAAQPAERRPADQRPAPTATPGPSEADLAAAALAEDVRKGRCDHPHYDYDGRFTSVRACVEGDLTAGDCDWHGEDIAIFECQYRAGDRDYVGAFVRELHDVSGGRITNLDVVQGSTVQVSGEFDSVADWHAWQGRHGDETLTRALYLWGRVFRRNHRVLANACVQISDSALSSRSQLAAWGATADGRYAILARRCEGD